MDFIRETIMYFHKGGLVMNCSKLCGQYKKAPM